MTYHQRKFPEDDKLIPTVFERFTTKLTVDGKEIPFHIIDSDEEYELDRKTVSHVKVVIICFSLISPKSYEDVETRWMKRIKKESSNLPCILVGTKADLRDNFDDMKNDLKQRGHKPISTQKGNELKEKICAVEYFECSSKLEINITNIFEFAAKAAVEHNNSHCIVF